MKLAVIGLGKMGANMARRLLRGNIEVVGFNRSPDITKTLENEEGLLAAYSLGEAIKALPSPRIVWLMLPSGTPTAETINSLIPMLSSGPYVGPVVPARQAYSHSASVGSLSPMRAQNCRQSFADTWSTG